MGFQKMYGFEGVCQSEVQVSIYELSVLGGPLHTSWSDLVGVRQLSNLKTGKQVFFQKNRVRRPEAIAQCLHFYSLY